MFKQNPRKSEYIAYLENHIRNVQNSWNYILKPVIIKDYKNFEDINFIQFCDNIIKEHDKSKYSEEEFDDYLNYFYPSIGYEPDEVAFNRAWCHHQNHNPHHWQYWILINDNGKLNVLDMDLVYIFEMLCDWHSFSAKDSTSTAYNWYNDNKYNIILSNNTRAKVEELLEYLKQPLIDF